MCGGVGSGKSLTALAFYVKHICKGRYARGGSSDTTYLEVEVPLYIITTAQKRDKCEWESEMAHFLLSTEGESLAPVVVDSWQNIKKYESVTDSFFIFDEHHLVGTGSWAKTFLKIAKSNRWVVLTATPGDVWMDYWAVFVANGYYRNVTDFRNQHVVYQRFAKFPKIQRYVGTGKLERLRREILISMDCSKEATRHHSYIQVGYDSESYSEAAKNRWNIFEGRPMESVSEGCYVLRKIVNSDPRRCEAVLNILSNHRKAIIFYNFNYELELLREMCSKNGIVHSEWNGQRHDELPSGRDWVYLVQYTAGSEGWNCVETDTVIFYSQNYSYKVLEQSCGRIDRINTPYTDLYYFHIFSDAPIDHTIRKCVKRKKVFNEKAFFSTS